MVKARLILIALAAFLCTAAGAQAYKWETYPMDGHRTGNSIPNTDNVEQAMGKVRGGVYHAPNGRRYRGSTAKVAKLMIDVQPRMAEVKEYIGNCPGGMPRNQAAIGNLIVDCLMRAASEATGLKVDVGLTNYGGIREDMPAGDVILDDIISMLPFKNYLVVVSYRGEDLVRLFDKMAERRLQVLGGVEVTVRDRKVVDLKVGGEEVDKDRIYHLATTDFLLTGGDNVFAAADALDIQMTDELIREGMLRYLRELRGQGRPIAYDNTPRVHYLDGEDGR